MKYVPDLDKNYEGLPVPRLELRWTGSEKKTETRSCIYELILPLRELDVRRVNSGGEETREVLRVEIDRQVFPDKCLPLNENENVMTPLVLSVNARWDAAALGLRVWAVCGTYETEITNKSGSEQGGS